MAAVVYQQQTLLRHVFEALHLGIDVVEQEVVEVGALSDLSSIC